MSKKDEKNNIQELARSLEQSQIVNVNVQDEMKKSFISYAMAVNVSRAIPDVRDGLKPVHRRILYAMGADLKLTSDKPHRKCAKIVGEVLGKYHPHGDSSVYDALVRLAQDFSIRYPLVDGQGNFGSVDGDSAAAYRYTEARLSTIANQMLAEIEKETVDFYPNFDDSEMQPTVLPSRYPNLLVNGADGIAVGMATNIPPHNLTEVINGTIAMIENPEISIDELMQFIPAPDYPTGALLFGRAAVKNAYRTGRGGVILRAKTEIEENNGRNRIIVTEIPYQVNKENLIKNIANLVKDKKIEGISDIHEQSDRDGMRIVFDIKRDHNPQIVLNMLFKHTQLQVKNGIIMLALVDGEPKVLNLKEMLYHYIEHQKTIITRRTIFDLNKAKEKAHILEGLMIALANIDEVIAVIKASSDRQDATGNLMNGFALTEKQAQAILDTRLHRLTSLEVEKVQEELAELHTQITYFEEILATPSIVNDIIKTELTQIRDKFGDARKTEISIDYGEIDIEDLIEKEDIVVSRTHMGYIKRLPVSEYRSQKRGGVGVTTHKTKDEDFVEDMFISNTHDELLFFSNFGKVYSIKGYEIPEGEKNTKGRAIINILQLSEGEKIQAVIPVHDKENGFLVLATRNGLIKKTPIKEFESIRKGGKIAISLTEGDSLISAKLTDGDASLLICSTDGKCIRFLESGVRPTGRSSQGVRSINLNDEDSVVDMIVLTESTQVLTITENGYGKRTISEEFKVQGRAGKGIKACSITEKTGKLVALKDVNEDNDIMVITDDGIIIRFAAEEISLIGRDTQGVRLIKVREECKVVSVAVSPKSDDEFEETEGENSEENK